MASGNFCGECGAPLNSPKKSAIRIGTAQTNDVILSDASIAEQHIEITIGKKPHCFNIRDLGSEKGTWVHGERISEPNVQGIVYNVSMYECIQLGNKPVYLHQVVYAFSQFAETSSNNRIVGREPPADIIIANPMVSNQHLEIRIQNGKLEIRDLQSSNGTTLDGQTVTDWTPLTPYNQLLLGAYRVPPYLIQEWLYLFEAKGSPDHTVVIPENGQITIGRNPECDITFDSLQVSWEHARIESKAGQWGLIDLGSSNGTYVNGSRIQQSRITATDRIHLGSIPLHLSKGRIAKKTPHIGNVRLDAINLIRTLPNKKTILDDVSVSIYPGELIALMGPSGAGKTTLLEILTAQKRPSSGWVLFNDDSLHDRPHLLAQIGYVPQEDIMHRDLTVFQVLYYAALMRLPHDLSRKTIIQHVEQLITRMGLAHIRDNIIGGEKERGISGGQRKRVNIALELLTEPSLLFLDEPTSGLDSTSTLEVLEVLRQLADAGKTIIMTIHQPRIEAFKCVDKLLLLAKGGKLAYFGPAMGAAEYFSTKSRLPFSTNANPADYVIDVLDPLDKSKWRSPDDWKNDYLQSIEYQQYVLKRLHKKEHLPTDKVMTSPPSRNALYQFIHLLGRYWTRKKRDKGSLGIQLLQPVIIGLLLALLFGNADSALPTDSQQLRDWHCLTKPDGEEKGDAEGTWFDEPPKDADMDYQEKYCQLDKQEEISAPVKIFLEQQKEKNQPTVWDPENDTHPAAKLGIYPTLFLLAAAAFWLGCSNVARELVSERPIYRRERRAGLPIISYLASIFILQLVLAMVQVLIMGMLVWMFVPLGAATMLTSWVVLFLTASAGISIGLLISGWAKTEVTAISVIPIVLLPQLMLAGYLKIWTQMGNVGQVLGSLLPLKWSFQTLVEIEYNNWYQSDELTIAEKKMTFTVSDVFGFSAIDTLHGMLILLLLSTFSLLFTLRFLKKERR